MGHTWFHTYFIFHAVVTLIKEHGIRSVIEIGGAEGFFIARLKAMFPGITAVNVEVSANALKHGRELFGNNDALLGDILALPFKDRSFDLVICSEVLEHIEDYRSAIRELERITNKVLLTTTPACHSSGAQKRFKPDYAMKLDGHIHYYLKEDILNEFTFPAKDHAYFHSWIVRGFLKIFRITIGNIRSRWIQVPFVKAVTYLDYLLSRYLGGVTKSQLFIGYRAAPATKTSFFVFDNGILGFLLLEAHPEQKRPVQTDAYAAFRDRLVCPFCRKPVALDADSAACTTCGKMFGKKEGFLDFRSDGAG
jgi:SAM-dependent methyltransferase